MFCFDKKATMKFGQNKGFYITSFQKSHYAAVIPIEIQGLPIHCQIKINFILGWDYTSSSATAQRKL